MRRLLEFSLAQPVVVLVLSAAFAIAGAVAFWNLPIEAFPELADPQVYVITLFDGHAAEEVERQVTLPLERELNGLPQLTRMRSVSIFGLSYITLTFDDAVDLYLARQQATERIGGADLPDGVKATLGPLATPTGEIFRYTLTGEHASPMRLRELQDWVMERHLKQVPGVADVVSFGGFEKQYQVEVDPRALQARGVTLQQVFAALGRSNANAGGNFIEHGDEQYVVRGLGTLAGTVDVENVVVAARNGTPIRVKDVARVVIGAAPRRGIVARDRVPEAVEGIVLMRRGENPSDVLDGLHKKIDQLNGGILPPDVRVDVSNDRGRLVHRTLVTVTHNLIVGAVLVVAVVGVFLMSLRAALIVALTIPLSLLGAFLYLKLRGLSANLLSLGAVDFGIIVDGAVIMVEHVARRLGGARTRQAAHAAVLDAAGEVARPTLYALLIIIVAYVPIFSLQRVEGRIFAPMANTVCAALVGALVFSFTLIPLLAFLFLRGGTGEGKTPVERVALRLYRPALAWALRNGATVGALAVGVLGLGLWRMSTIGTEFLPTLNEGALYITATLPPSIGLEHAAYSAVPRIRDRLLAFPEVRSVLSQLGGPDDGTDPAPANNLEFFVDLKPHDEWPAGVTAEQLVGTMRERLEELPGIEYNFSQPIKDNIEENISGINGQVAIKVFGDDLDELRHVATEVRRAVAGVAGVADLAVVHAAQLPQVHVVVDRQSIARYGLNIADVEDVIETGIGGRPATTLWGGERPFDGGVRVTGAGAAAPRALPRLRVPTPDGAVLPLAQLAKIEIAPGEAAIDREANNRFVAVRCNVHGRDLGGFVAEAQRRVAADVHLPANTFITWGGECENQRRAMARLSLVIRGS